MKWEKVASIKFQAGATFGFTSGRTRPRFETVAIFLGPKRVLKCGCGKTCLHLPEKLEAPSDACVHVRALYGNGVVKEDTVHTASRMSVTFGGAAVTRNFGKVYLTPLGRELFAWRHVAQALE